MTNDLISREALMDEISAALLNATFTSVRAREQHEEKIQWALDLVGNAPTVDAAPVRHGRWKTQVTSPCCSICNYVARYWWRFCPNCGAKMDE